MKNEDQIARMMGLVSRGVQELADDLRGSIANEHLYVRESVESYLSLLQAGGKRARGMLTICGYQMHGGTDSKNIAKAAAIVEAMHAYLLVVDDVADNAATRRGAPTAHVRMEKFLEEQGAKGDVEQTAADMAISAALLAQHYAQEIFGRLPVDSDNLVKAITSMNGHLARTNLGQVLDMASTTGVSLSEADIINISKSKTAYYTFQMPLEVGALLAGAPQQSLGLLAEYSLHAGLAFQLQDDIMGVFGDESKMGKSAKGDIMEGKQTLLMAYAKQVASPEQLKILQESLGNSELSDEQFSRCQAIIKDTGALKEVEEYAKREANLAIEVMDNSHPDWPQGMVDYLKDIASFAINRSK